MAFIVLCMELGLSEDSQSSEQLKLLKEITIITSDQRSVLSPLHPPSLLSHSPAQLIVVHAAAPRIGFMVMVTYGHSAQRVTLLPTCKTIRFRLLLYFHKGNRISTVLSSTAVDTPYLHLFLYILIMTSSFT